MEVFRTGTHVDASGHSRTWEESDLDKIVSKFEEMGEDVPATIGHPDSDTAPAFGWFKKVFRKGNCLFAELSDVVDEFGEMLKKKMFKNRSIALRGDLSLRHIAFLGAAAPAVKGMADFAFKAEDEFSTYDFEEAEESSAIMEKLEKFFAEFRQFIKPKTEDQKMPTNEELTAKVSELEKTIETNNTAFAEKEKAFGEEKTKLTADLEAANKKSEELESKFAEAEKAKKTAEFGSFLDGEIEAGRVLPANKDALLKTMEALDGQEAMDFGEGDDKGKITPLEVFKNQISKGKTEVHFGEQYKSGSDAGTAGSQLNAAAKEIQNKNSGMAFGEAFKQAQEENPELTELYNKTGE